jgi:hypothetical protein
MECGQDGVGIRLERVYVSVATVCVEIFISYTSVTFPAPDVAADVFGTGIIHSHILP